MTTLAEALELAIACHQAERLDEAEAMYRRILAAMPGQPDTMHLLALVRRRKGDFTEAYALLSGALRQRPDFAEGFNNLGNLLRDCGRDEEAEACYRRAVTLDPGLVPSLKSLTALLLGERRAEDVRVLLEQALARGLDDAGIHFNLGQAYDLAGRLADAEAAFRRAVELNPAMTDAVYRWGTVLFAQGRFEGALAVLRRGPLDGWTVGPVRAELSAMLGGHIAPAPADGRIRLSIVIPTYERRGFLAALLDSLLPQVAGRHDDTVEIVISDNHSQDGTETLCRERAGAYGFVRYIRQSRNLGGQINVVGTVYRARGRFTWIIGDDDLVLPGAVDQILDTLDGDGSDLLLLNKMVKSVDLAQTLIERQCPVDIDRDYDGLVAMGRDVGILTNISFLSAVVFRTAAFTAGDAAWYIAMNSFYPHLGMLLEGFHHRRCRLVARPLVVQRVFNMRSSAERQDETINHAAYLNLLRMFIHLDRKGVMRFCEIETVPEEHLPSAPGQRGTMFHIAGLVLEGIKQNFLKVAGRPDKYDLFTLAHLETLFLHPDHRQRLRAILAALLEIDRQFALLVRV